MKIDHVRSSAFKLGVHGVRLRAGDLDAVIVDWSKGRQVPKAALTVLPPPAGDLSKQWVVRDRCNSRRAFFNTHKAALDFASLTPDSVIYEVLIVPVREAGPLDGDVEWATRASAKSFCAAWEGDEHEVKP